MLAIWANAKRSTFTRWQEHYNFARLGINAPQVVLSFRAK